MTDPAAVWPARPATCANCQDPLDGTEYVEIFEFKTGEWGAWHTSRDECLASLLENQTAETPDA
ncbi:hypothetical protein [Streptomyces sp. NPDC001194]|uniref:hypothetical protein n=1 Tax=Streptomyces sp. NPDC001194 TaxID=3364547 RepID=UPI0036742EF0